MPKRSASDDLDTIATRVSKRRRQTNRDDVPQVAEAQQGHLDRTEPSSGHTEHQAYVEEVIDEEFAHVAPAHIHIGMPTITLAQPGPSNDRTLTQPYVEEAVDEAFARTTTAPPEVSTAASDPAQAANMPGVLNALFGESSDIVAEGNNSILEVMQDQEVVDAV